MDATTGTGGPGLPSDFDGGLDLESACVRFVVDVDSHAESSGGTECEGVGVKHELAIFHVSQQK